jgi:serine/threonine protein kinase
MISADWQKVKRILSGALERSPQTRASFVEDECAGDTRLRREVESLLAFENEEADFIGESAFDFFGDGLPSEKDLARSEIYAGRRIGNYEIVRRLGSGGMGTVFLARRAGEEFEQTVAVKIVKQGIGTDQAALRRFYLERRILAQLEHQNIARLIDGGTTAEENLPYFVMEYVEDGVPLTEYARAKNLSLDERLDLFADICAAVGYAHRQLIVHRDLKPSNILVNRNGAPKLLDFGIAKITTGDDGGAAKETRTQFAAFTPEYASPEQMRGEKLSTATDVYSLGVILYELITGTRPFNFDGKNIGEIIDSASRIEPTAPSRISGQPKTKDQKTKGEDRPTNPAHKIQNLKSSDLDNIVLKALKRDPARRYLSVEQFAEDVQRFQAGFPVSARRDTFRYRAEKFIRRNPLVFAASVVAFAALVAGVAAVAYQARIANIERARAERRFNDVRRLANSFVFEINEEIERSPIKARALLVERAVEYLDNLAREAEGDQALQSELAAAYEKIGDVQSELYGSNVGDSTGAIESYRKSLALRETLYALAAPPERLRAGLALAAVRSKSGDIMAKTGDIGAAVEHYRESVALSESLLEVDAAGDVVEVRRQAARSRALYGHAVLRTGALPEVLDSYERSLKILESLAAENALDAKGERALAVVHSFVAFVFVEMNDTARALEYYRRAIEICERTAAANPGEKIYRATLSSLRLAYGYGLRAAGDFAGSQAQQRLALRATEELLRADPNDMNVVNEIGDDYFETAQTLAAAGKAKESLGFYGKALENYEQVRRSDERNAHVRFQVNWVRVNEADALLAAGAPDDALAEYAAALGTLGELSAQDPNNTEWKHRLALCRLRIGEAYLAKNDRARALRNFQIALPLFEDVAAKSPANERRRADLETLKRHLEKFKN